VCVFMLNVIIVDIIDTGKMLKRDPDGR
jgi:hypothetical protein